MTLEGKIQWLMDRPKVWMEVDSKEERIQIANIMKMVGIECEWRWTYDGQHYIKVFIT